jgi:hypothetical protein
VVEKVNEVRRQGGKEVEEAALTWNSSRAFGFEYVPWYIGRREGDWMAKEQKFIVERVQTGVRMEKRLLKVLKAFAEYHDLTLGDLLEGIVLHAFDGKCPFGGESLRRIKELKKFYGLELDSRASHRLRETGAGGHGKDV